MGLAENCYRVNIHMHQQTIEEELRELKGQRWYSATHNNCRQKKS